MFVNPSLDEIFLINSDNGTIHAASRLSPACGINGEENGHFGILPCEAGERGAMLAQFEAEYGELTLCPSCFARELKERRRRAYQAEAMASRPAQDPSPTSAGVPSPEGGEGDRG